MCGDPQQREWAEPTSQLLLIEPLSSELGELSGWRLTRYQFYLGNPNTRVQPRPHPDAGT